MSEFIAIDRICKERKKRKEKNVVEITLKNMQNLPPKNIVFCVFSILPHSELLSLKFITAFYNEEEKMKNFKHFLRV